MMYVRITDAVWTILMHKTLKIDPDVFTDVIDPYLEVLAVAVGCVFLWYLDRRSV